MQSLRTCQNALDVLELGLADWQVGVLTGLAFATLSCLWRYYSDDAGFDELAIRFAVYFVAFTIGFRLIVNMLAGRKR